MSERADRLKRLAADIYAASDKQGGKCERHRFRQKALKALPEDEQRDVSTYLYDEGRKRQAAVRGQFKGKSRQDWAIAVDKGKVS
jgi:hypothetical protein